MNAGGSASPLPACAGGTKLGGTKAGASGTLAANGTGAGSSIRNASGSITGSATATSSTDVAGAADAPEFQRIPRERGTDRPVRVDRSLDLAANIEIADFVDRGANFAQVRLAHHFVDMGLELGGHPPRLLDPACHGADRDRHILRPDRDQRDHGNQCKFRPGEIKHGDS